MGLSYAGTGHRPPRLAVNGLKAYSAAQEKVLDNVVGDYFWTRMDAKEIVSGCALGFDTALAQIALRFEISLICAVPFDGFEKKWPKESQERYHDILRQAKEVHFIGSLESGKSVTRLNFERDEWMVDRCDRVVALFDGFPKGGTHHTVEYARKRGKSVDNLWDEFLTASRLMATGSASGKV